MNNLNVYTQLAAAPANVEIIRSTYNARNTQSFTNVKFQVQGTIFENRDLGTNIYIDNVDIGKLLTHLVDMYQANTGFESEVYCNFPEAVLNHTFVMKNSRYYNSQEKEAFLRVTAYNSGDSNITVSLLDYA